MRRIAALALVSSLAACARTDPGPFRPGTGDGGGTTDGGGGDGGIATLSSIDVTPPTATTAVNVPVQFTATGHYSNGTVKNLTATATWTSSDQAVARPDPQRAGSFLAQKSGTATVTATVGNVKGSAALTVSKATIQGVAISPPSASISVGGTQQFTAMAKLSDGSSLDVTASAAWSSSDGKIATVAGGLATGIALGNATITATIAGVTGTATLDVGQGSLVSIDVEPQGLKLPENVTNQYTCTAVYSTGQKTDVTKTGAWKTDDPAVADFSPTTPGLLRTHKAGPAVITCSFGGKDGTAGLTVTAATLTGLALTPPSASLAQGVKQRFKATGTFSDGSTTDLTTSAAWSIADPNVASVSNVPGSQGEVTALNAGTTTVSATVLGVTGTASVVVTPATLTALVITPATATTTKGKTVPFIANGTYTDGKTRDVTSSATWDSSDLGVATIQTGGPNAGVATALASGTTGITATFGGQTAKAQLTVSSASITGLTVSPSTLDMSYGWTRQVTATATYSDGSTQDVTQQATWSSSDTSVAVVSNTAGSAGVVTSLTQDGSSTVTATLSGFSATCAVTVQLGQLQSLEISPINPSVPSSQTVRFQAIAILTDGNAFYVTRQANWSSSNQSVATMNGQPGAARAVSAGTSTITASLQGVSASTTMTVTGATLVKLQVEPINPSLPAGSYIGLSAVAIYSDGTAIDVSFGRQTSWVSSDPNVVDPTFGGYAVSPGTATITASYQGVSGSTVVTVTAATIKNIQITPVNPQMAVNTNLRFFATAIYTDNTSQDISYYATWSTSNAAVAVVSNAGFQTGVATGLSAGTVTVSAIYTGITGTTSLTVTSATVTSIQLTPVNPSLPVGGQAQMRAAAIYSDGTSRDVTRQANWSSSDSNVAVVSNATFSTGVLTAVAPGTATLTADYAGVAGTTLATVTAATLTAIQVTPVNPTSPAGLQVFFTATGVYSDGTSKDVSNQATWQSSTTTVAQVSDTFGSKGDATTLAAGTTTISASLSGVTGTSLLTVTSATLVSLQLTPFNPSTPAGTALRMTATGVYSDHTSHDLTFYATWTSSNTAVAQVGTTPPSSGRVSALAAGTATISADYQGVTGTATFTVTAATLTAVQISPATLTLPTGFVRLLTATAIFSDNTTRDVTQGATWTSSDPAKAVVSNSAGTKGELTTVAAGPATISAAWGGMTGTAAVTVSAATLGTLTIAPNPATGTVGASTPLTATATYSDGSSYDVTLDVFWDTLDATVAQVSNAAGSQGQAYCLKAGGTTVRAWLGGKNGSDALTCQ